MAQEGARETQLKDSAVIKELSSRIDSLKGDVREEVGKVHMTVGVAEAAALRAERAVNSAGTQGTDSASAAHGTREAQLRREVGVRHQTIAIESKIMTLMSLLSSSCPPSC